MTSPRIDVAIGAVAGAAKAALVVTKHPNTLTKNRGNFMGVRKHPPSRARLAPIQRQTF
jgi:hypothetical protein